MQMFYNQGGISILYVVEAIGLRPRDLPNNRHPRPFNHRSGVKKLLLQHEESSLRLLAIAARLLSILKRKLQEFDLRAILQSFRFQYLTTEHKHPPLVGLR